MHLVGAWLSKQSWVITWAMHSAASMPVHSCDRSSGRGVVSCGTTRDCRYPNAPAASCKTPSACEGRETGRIMRSRVWGKSETFVSTSATYTNNHSCLSQLHPHGLFVNNNSCSKTLHANHQDRSGRYRHYRVGVLVGSRAWKLRAAALTPASLVRSAPMASWLDTAPRLNSVAARSNAADDRSLRVNVHPS